MDSQRTDGLFNFPGSAPQALLLAEVGGIAFRLAQQQTEFQFVKVLTYSDRDV